MGGSIKSKWERKKKKGGREHAETRDTEVRKNGCQRLVDEEKASMYKNSREKNKRN